MTSRLFAGFSMPFSWSILPVIVLVSSLSAVWGIDTIRLTDVTQQTGIDFRHTDGSSQSI
ncbi:MAG: hypothetical protein ACYS80_18130 [Planctomycetota bacterium]